MVAPKLTVDVSGPFFTRDPGATLRQNVRRMMEGIAAEGEQAAQAAWPVYTGAGRAGIRGRVESLTGRPWMASAVISATHVYPWPKGGQRQYRGGKVEAKRRVFAGVARSLRGSRAVLRANLTDGLE